MDRGWRVQMGLHNPLARGLNVFLHNQRTEPHMKTILAINSTHRRVAFLVLLSFLAMC